VVEDAMEGSEAETEEAIEDAVEGIEAETEDEAEAEADDEGRIRAVAGADCMSRREVWTCSRSAWRWSMAAITSGVGPNSLTRF